MNWSEDEKEDNKAEEMVLGTIGKFLDAVELFSPTKKELEVIDDQEEIKEEGKDEAIVKYNDHYLTIESITS